MPGMNDTLPCGTETALRRHKAHGQVCAACETAGAQRMPSALWTDAARAGLAAAQAERETVR